MVFTDAVIEMLERKAHGALVGRGKPYGTADFREEYSRQANKLLAALEKLMGSQ